MFETLFGDEPAETQTIPITKSEDEKYEPLTTGLTEFKKTTPPLFAVLPSTAKFSGKIKSLPSTTYNMRARLFGFLQII